MTSEYFMMNSSEVEIENLKFNGKYSFQYVDGAVFENCNFDTKDAFWHAKNITVKNSIVKGEYLAWYCAYSGYKACGPWQKSPYQFPFSPR